jgi:DNA-binding response OmpR family regulator
MLQRRVLVVDDEEAIRMLMASIFESAGYAVDGAATGREAMEKLKPRPDLVTVDLMMPDMSGWQIVERICAQPQAPAVIIVSGRGDMDSHPLRSCIAGVVQKPFMPSDLIDFCDTVLRDRASSGKRKPAFERRRTARRELVMDVRVAAYVGNPLLNGRVLDMSPLGAELELPSSMEAGQKLRLALSFPGRGRPLLVDGSIRFCAARDGNWSCGLEFANVTPEVSRELSTLLQIASPVAQ